MEEDGTTRTYKKLSYNVSGQSEMVEDLLDLGDSWLPPDPTEADAVGDADGNKGKGLDVQMSQVLDQYQTTTGKCLTCGKVGHYTCNCPKWATLGKMKVLNTSGSTSEKGCGGSLMPKFLSLRSN